MCLAGLETKANVCDREFITGLETTDLDPLAVDANPICATKITNHYFIVIVRHAAVVARDAQRIQTRITLRMPPDNHHGAIQGDVWTFVQGHQTCGHKEAYSLYGGITSSLSRSTTPISPQIPHQIYYSSSKQVRIWNLGKDDWRGTVVPVPTNARPA
jgi:hypothetical protein